MQTRKDVYGKVAGLVGDSYFDWLTPEYFSPLCETAYEMSISYLNGTCAPFIEKVVTVPGVSIGVDESDLVASAISDNVYPLKYLIKPRYVDFKPVGAPANQYKPVSEFQILPDTPSQAQAGAFDIRVRGDFRPQPLLTEDTVVEIAPLAGHALALSIAALIGIERPNQGWVDNYGKMAQNAWDEIAADLMRQQQHLTARLGSPNRNNQRRGGWAYPLQGNMGWEWRGFGLFLKLI